MMEIQIEGIGQNGELALLKLNGALDAASYKDVIERGKLLAASGIKNMLIDMEHVKFVSSSGIVALHSLALIMRGEKPSNIESGWEAMRAAADYAEDASNYEAHFKLLKPNPRVVKTLELAGFDRSFEIFDDLDSAIASFA